MDPSLWPKTVDAALTRLKAELPLNTLDLVRGTPAEEDALSFHWGLGSWIRGEFGLWAGNRELLLDCGIRTFNGLEADAASGAILRALRRHLVVTSTPEEMERGRRAWQEREARRTEANRLRLEREAAKDAAITTRRCPSCGQPCPRYRLTCKHCGVEVGREM